MAPYELLLQLKSSPNPEPQSPSLHGRRHQPPWPYEPRLQPLGLRHLIYLPEAQASPTNDWT
uniref:Uncharacterized protein n=1 Tax=Oryza meridionalis TaxID=40149 RepID=A0A0E0CWZ0_9ORYZ